MRATIVIPAHDEEAVVGRCLDAFHADAGPGEWDVVVAANGCTDRTVAVARAHPSRPTCLDLPEPGKTAALNAADAVAATFPRIYLDADIEVSSATLRALVATLEQPGVLAAAPCAHFRTDEASVLVRSFYRVWRELPFLHDAHVGSGIYAVNEEGHARIAPFPALVAEDEYVRRSFTSDERRSSPGTFEVRVARTLPALLRRGTRSRAGNAELARRMPVAGTPRRGTSTGAHVLSRAAHPRELPHVVVFAAVTLAVRVLAAVKRRRGDTRWERDDSSRQPAPPPRPTGSDARVTSPYEGDPR